MKRGLARWIWAIVAAAVLLTFALLLFNSRTSTARVDVVDVTRQNLSSMISTNGKVEPITPVSFRASFPTFVEKVYVMEGQQVKRGQPLFDLDDKSVQADLARARADLATQEDALAAAKAGGRADQAAKLNADLQKAQASRDQLQRDQDALTKLVAEKAATPQELEQNRVALAQADADVHSLEKSKQTFEQQTHTDAGRGALLVEQAQNQIHDLEDQVRSAHATAPFDATLYSLPIRRGDFVKVGDLLAEMADLHHVRVRAFIDEPELGQLEPDQNVEITWDAHPERVWNGRTEILPKQVVSHGARNVGELLCSVSNDQLDLLPNTTVDVQIQVSQQTGVLVLPRGAVFIDGNRRFVFRVDGDRLRRTDIKVGIANPTMIQVVSGVNEGDMIAVPGAVALKQNLRIIAVRPE